jgi:hypothetical protein
MSALATTDAFSYVLKKRLPPYASTVDYRAGRLRDMVTTAVKVAMELDHPAEDFGQGTCRAPTVQLKFSEGLLSGYEAFGRVMNKYAELASHWQEPDATPPTRETREAAGRALYHLLFAGVIAPSAMLHETGIIGGFWRKGKAYLSIDFEPDGNHPWAYSAGNGTYLSGTWVEGPVSPELARLIHELC